MLLLEQLEKRGAVSESSLAVLLQWAEINYRTVLPADYIEFLRYSDGTVGHGPDIYVILDAAEEVPATTEGYGTAEFAPGLVVIGSDGFGNLIGIDVRQEAPDASRYLLTDSLALSWDDQELSGASYAGSLLELLQAMTQNNAK